MLFFLHEADSLIGAGSSRLEVEPLVAGQCRRAAWAGAFRCHYGNRRPFSLAARIVETFSSVPSIRAALAGCVSSSNTSNGDPAVHEQWRGIQNTLGGVLARAGATSDR